MIHELTTENEMKHKHAELIKAWADGAVIQYRTTENNWCDCSGNSPYWSENFEYRIKPEPKPDVVKYLCAEKHGEGCGSLGDTYYIVDHWHSQLKLTFDGETGKLKSAEVIS